MVIIGYAIFSKSTLLASKPILHGGRKMNKLIEDLLSIEQAATQSLAALEEERTTQAKLTEAEIARHLQEIKHKTAQAIEAIKQSAKAALATELAELDTQYNQKTAQLKQLFEQNAATWRKEWAGYVLFRP